MRPAFGSRLRTTLLTVVVVGFLALLPNMATEARFVPVGGSASLACGHFAEFPDAAALRGMQPETASDRLEAEAVPLLGHVSCTYRNDHGTVFWTSSVHGMRPAGVVVCYVLALTVAVAAWPRG
jgi:hypothetical protein